MTREAKLRYHLEMVVVRDYLGVLLTGAEITALADRATPEQHETAFERALVKSPVLVGDERIR